jgi:hypothetical protein
MALGAAVTSLEPEAVSDGVVSDLWADFDRVERLAAAAKTLLARRVEESEVWRRAGYRSTADYLAALAGGSVTAARGVVATSKRLAKLPATEAALRAGSLSTAQAGNIADAASVNPDAEHDLLDMAGAASLRELTDACGRAKAAGDPDPEETYRRIHRNRRLTHSRDSEGAWCLNGRGPVDAGSVVGAALDSIIDELFVKARDEGRRETREHLAFDALVELAQRGLAQQEAASDAADTAAADASEPAPKKRRARKQEYLGILRIDLAALRRGRVEGDELCEIAGVGPVPVTRARELLGEAVLKLVITAGVDVHSVTHLGRRPTVAQSIALTWQMPCCSVEGCSATWTQDDHRKDWALTHWTRLDGLDRLCGHHHKLKTALGWALVEGKGKRPLVPPDDPRHPDNTRSDDRGSTAADEWSGSPGGGQPVTAPVLLEN